MTIEELDFSVPTYNAIKRGGINTLDELINKTDDELLEIRNLNRKRLLEIHQILESIPEEKECYYCNTTPYGETINVAQQKFNDGTISNIKLNPCNTSLLTVDTWNVPIKGHEANMYTITKEIKFCPMCGRKL
jgi:predicted transcriptional regulator